MPPSLRWPRSDRLSAIFNRVSHSYDALETFYCGHVGAVFQNLIPGMPQCCMDILLQTCNEIMHGKDLTLISGLNKLKLQCRSASTLWRACSRARGKGRLSSASALIAVRRYGTNCRQISTTCGRGWPRICYTDNRTLWCRVAFVSSSKRSLARGHAHCIYFGSHGP